MQDIVIHTENLSRDFKNVRAVNDLSLEVPRGIVFGFLGPNGSGKTTTIRLLLGLLEPTHGRAEVLGFDSRTHSGDIRARCGALLEYTGLYDRLSAEDNLSFYARAWGLPASERSARIRSILDSLELWERRRELVDSWSRGMKQKLAIARAMLHHPEILFLDEPTAGLDPIAAAALREDLETLVARQGLTVFLTTHNLAEAEKLCGRVAVIRQGRLLAQGSPAELRAHSGAPRIEITGRGFTPTALSGLRALPLVAGVTQNGSGLTVDLKQEAESAPLVSALVAAGAEIEEVRKGKASLEDVFLTLMEEEK